MVPIWIFTERGFFTFVTDRKDPEFLWLRARMREHLEDNFPGVIAEEHPGADYLYRAKVKRTDVAARIAQLVMDSRIDSHFKDVMIRTAAKPKTGSLSNVMYAIWNGAAQWQPYRPYSKVPRDQEKPFTYSATGGQNSTTSALPAYSGYSGRAADYDWSTRSWDRKGTPVGEPARDDAEVALQKVKTALGDLTFEDISELPNDLYVSVLDGMSQTELDTFLDWADDEMNAEPVLELGKDEDTGAALARHFPSPTSIVQTVDWAQIETDRRKADRERQTAIQTRQPGKRGKRGRKNRHNQHG